MDRHRASVEAQMEAACILEWVGATGNSTAEESGAIGDWLLVPQGVIAHLAEEGSGANKSLQGQAHFGSMFPWAVEEFRKPGSSFVELGEDGKRHWRGRNFEAAGVDTDSAVR